MSPVGMSVNGIGLSIWMVGRVAPRFVNGVVGIDATGVVTGGVVGAGVGELQATGKTNKAKMDINARKLLINETVLFMFLLLCLITRYNDKCEPIEAITLEFRAS